MKHIRSAIMLSQSGSFRWSESHLHFALSRALTSGHTYNLGCLLALGVVVPSTPDHHIKCIGISLLSAVTSASLRGAD